MLYNFKTFPISQSETLEKTFIYLKDTESLETFSYFQRNRHKKAK